MLTVVGSLKIGTRTYEVCAIPIKRFKKLYGYRCLGFVTHSSSKDQQLVVGTPCSMKTMIHEITHAYEDGLRSQYRDSPEKLAKFVENHGQQILKDARFFYDAVNAHYSPRHRNKSRTRI